MSIPIEKLRVEGIPALRWGPESDRVILAVHGSHSSKIDDCVYILAEEAAAKGRQVLSFDLPLHGERIFEEPPRPTMVEEARREVEVMLTYLRRQYRRVDLFGCSMGAYFGLLACAGADVGEAWFLSPVTDMTALIRGMMAACGVSEEVLAEKRIIPTPFGETLDWDYYHYTAAHPVTAWPHPTHILRGEGDTLCRREEMAAFAARFGADLTEQPGGEHWFHTGEELAFYRQWLRDHL